MSTSPVFLVGCPRSGTSLLRDLLRSHPRLAFPSESHFIPSFYRGFGDPRSDRAARNLAARIRRLMWVRRWNLDLDPSILAHCRSFSGLVSGLYCEFARRKGKPRWGDKTPEYVTEIPLLFELFPAARVVHLYRDGRDVARSWIAAPFGPASTHGAASAWRRMVTAGRHAGQGFPDSYLEVRYESLVGEPEATMRQVCAFIGEDFDPAVLRPTRLPFKLRRQLIATRPWLSPTLETEVVCTRAESWRRDMARKDRQVFEWAAGALLSELGYETEGVSCPPSPRRRLALGLAGPGRRVLRRLNAPGIEPATFVFMNEARIRGRLRLSRPAAG